MGVRLEILRELHLVEKHPGIMVLVVESILEPPDALHRPIHVLIPTKHQQDRIRLSELGGKGWRIYHIDCVWPFLPVLAAEQMRHRRLLAVRFVREAEDRMQTDLWEVR